VIDIDKKLQQKKQQQKYSKCKTTSRNLSFRICYDFSFFSFDPLCQDIKVDRSTFSHATLERIVGIDTIRNETKRNDTIRYFFF
jgi:hypothetical protein